MPAKKISAKYTLILIISIVLLMVGLIATKPVPEAVLVEVKPLQVSVTQVVVRDVQPVVTLSGYLQPAQKVGLAAEVAGQVLERVLDAGDVVQAGDVLLRLDGRDAADALAEAKARRVQELAAIERDERLLTLARHNRKLQQQEVTRQQRLGTASLASGSALDGAQQILFQLQGEEERLVYLTLTAQSRRELAQAAVNRAQRQLDRSDIRAPFAGVLNRVDVDQGDRVKLNQVVAELVNLAQLDLYLEVDSRTAAVLSQGQAVNIRCAGMSLDGNIVALQRTPAANTFTHQMRIRLDNALQALMPGQLARAELPLLAQPSALIVPVEALVHDDGKTYVFIVEDNKTQRRLVQLGIRQGLEQVVLSGVGEGEQIIARDVAALTDDMAVQY